jgi:hypothetical protein
LPVRVPLTKEQRDHLCAVREVQLAEWRAGRPQVVDALFVHEPVVRLMSSMGRAVYLGLDGRVWVGNLDEGELPRVLDDPKDVASCIVRWSAAIGLADLVEALAPMPVGGEVCSLCKGTRERPAQIIPRAEDGFRYFCRRCGGLGWTMPAGHAEGVVGAGTIAVTRQQA